MRRIPDLSTTAAALALGVMGFAAGAQGPPDFNRDILPILQRSCLNCHSGPSAQGGIRLESAAAAIQSGSATHRAVVPHSPASSPLIQRVTAADEDRRMPPGYSKLPRLAPAEVELLRRWIEAGPPIGGSEQKAITSTHWSLNPLAKPIPPHGPGNIIDRFIRAKLAVRGLKPSSPADRRTLIRRLYFDLTGLPPTVEQVASFLSDRRPDSWARQVDALLASPRYGERWARHWMDTIHFADSHGFEHDIGRDNAWPYRDYLISALNADISWTRFIREQLAADYFYPDRPGLTPALGYLGAGTFDLSAYTTAPRNFELVDRDDLVTQTMSAFVSTTANCARCHAHKFDPIPQEDYYALQAVFSGITKGDRKFDASMDVTRQRNVWDAQLKLAASSDTASLTKPENVARAEAWIKSQPMGAKWLTPSINSAIAAEGSTLTYDADGVVISSGKRPERDTYTVTLSMPASTVSAVRLDLLASNQLPKGGPGRQDNGNLHLSEFELQKVTVDGKSVPLKISHATADFNQDGWGVERAIDGDTSTAWGIYPQVGRSHEAVFSLAVKQEYHAGDRLVAVLKQLHGGGHLIGRFRLSVIDAAPSGLSIRPLDVEAALRVPTATRTATQTATVTAYGLREQAAEELAKLPETRTVYAAGTEVEVATVGKVTIKEPHDVHLLERGDVDKPKQVVPPGALSAVNKLPSRFTLQNAANEAERRAALANWIADRNNPLTWRSIVNRVWHFHFGKGICDTPGDFGRMGGTPSHQELLDWLAVWFRDDAKGSLKALHRLIVTSETYRQSSAVRPDLVKADAENRLLGRQNIQRLDADSYRDFANASSGALDLTMGGPGVRNFTSRPGPQLTPALDYAAYDWNSPGSARRSIYRHVWRGIPDPFMDALDFPDMALLTPARTFSVSSLQALSLYNNAFVLHSAELLAQRVQKDSPVLDAQVVSAIRCVWLRSPSAHEKITFTDYAKRRGLPAMCRVLLNTNEFLFVE